MPDRRRLGAGGKCICTVPVAVGTYQVSFLPPDAPAPGDVEADKLANANDKVHDLYHPSEEVDRTFRLDRPFSGTAEVDRPK